MPRVPLDEIPDHGRLWVFPASRALEPSEAGLLLTDVDDFLDGWAAHGVPLRAGRELREGRFLLVAVDVDAELPSGCSIDALTNRLRAFGSEKGLSLIDHAPVWYRSDDGVKSASRPAFKALARDGAVSPATHVFDPTLVRVGQLRSGALERPAAETWHARAFFREQRAER